MDKDASSTKSVWFVLLAGEIKGPFSLPELKELKGFTPDTLVWKEGMEKWLAAREVIEFKTLFAEQEEPPPPEEVLDRVPSGKLTGEDLALSLPNADPPLLFWLIFSLLIIAYALFQFYFAS